MYFLVLRQRYEEGLTFDHLPPQQAHAQLVQKSANSC